MLITGNLRRLIIATCVRECIVRTAARAHWMSERRTNTPVALQCDTSLIDLKYLSDVIISYNSMYVYITLQLNFNININ